MRCRGRAAVRELVQIELAEQDRARVLQSARDFGIFGRNAVLEQLARAGGANAGGVDVVLERDRNAVQRPAPLPTLLLGLHLPRRGERLFGDDGDEGVQLRVVLVDSLQARLRQLDRRDALAANEIDGFLEGERGQIRGGCSCHDGPAKAGHDVRARSCAVVTRNSRRSVFTSASPRNSRSRRSCGLQAAASGRPKGLHYI